MQRLVEYQFFTKNKVSFVDTLSRRTHFWDTAVPYGSEYNHNVESLIQAKVILSSLILSNISATSFTPEHPCNSS